MCIQELRLLAEYSSNTQRGDFYRINFNAPARIGGVDYNNVSSNSEAIVKQGAALFCAIDWLLLLYDTKKVNLVGHSMGGLAAREFMQRWGGASQLIGILISQERMSRFWGDPCESPDSRPSPGPLPHFGRLRTCQPQG